MMETLWKQVESGMLQGLMWLNHLLEPYLELLAFAWVSTFLVIFGNDLLLWLKKQIATLPLFGRLSIFVVFSTFGFSVLMEHGVPLIVDVLYATPVPWRLLLILLGFYLTAYFAQKRGLL